MSKWAHVLCVSSLTGKAMLQMSEHAGAMLIFSSRKLVTLLDSSVGRLDHPHSPLLSNSNQEAPSQSVDQKEILGSVEPKKLKIPGSFEPFQERRIAHLSVGSSSGPFH